jgi:hypothetical protein
MKNRIISLLLCWVLLTSVFAPVQEARAVIPIADIIKQAVAKVIKAFDLMIQRLQNETIWLQNAQKVLENKLAELKLTEIAQWTQKHKDLFKEYYDGLWKVKTLLSAYQRINQVIDKQKRIVQEYKRAWSRVSGDNRFTEKEIDYMYRVYKGIISESVRNIDQILGVINSFNTQMTDAQRLAIITQASDRIEQNFVDLLEFNMNTYQLSLNRAKTQYEVNRIKSIYGIP